jgi:hypothetical protein
MQLGRYRLLAQLGAGADGTSYRAAHAGEAREVRALTGASAAPERWRGVLRRLRLAAILNHPAAMRVRKLDLDHT